MKRVAANNQQRESDRQQELRALDAWIAEHVMGFVRTDIKCHPSDNRTIGGVLFSPPGCNHDCGQSSYVKHYTTDPAAAMEVLRKCIDHVGAISEIRIY